MGALNPLLLLAAATVAVPVFLHLYHRHRARRIVFPALRYLERTEREHARQIRFRQLLLLLLRVGVLLVIVAAGARLFFRGRGSAHPPTAVVMVLDNSLSASAVVGEERVLDELRRLAVRTLDAATREDRFWIIRVGEPWLPAVPVGPVEARRIVLDTESSAAAGDLGAAVERAVELLSTSELDVREIHLLSDLQRSGFPGPAGEPAKAGDGEIPLVVWRPDRRPPSNASLVDVEVGGGLPPLEGQRSEVTVLTAGPTAEPDDRRELPVRIWLEDRLRGAATVPAGSAVSIALPPSGSGWIRGYAESDPDALRADDRRYFSYRSRPAPRVAVRGEAGRFIADATAVLEEAGQMVAADPGRADVLFTAAGRGLEARGATTAALVVPPGDPALLPALNRRLSDAGIPWRYEPAEGGPVGEAPLEGRTLPEPLEGIRVRRAFALSLVGDPPAPPGTLATWAGEPWAVEGADARGRRYLLLASSLEPASTDLPVSAAMVRFVDWTSLRWAGRARQSVDAMAGQPLPAPSGATHVRLPGGELLEIDGTRTVRATRAAGFYTFMEGDSTVTVEAVNVPPAESALERLQPGELEGLLGGRPVTVDEADAWEGAVFRVRQGPELWRPLLFLALLLLAAESLVAAAGRSEPHRPAGARVGAGAATRTSGVDVPA